MGRCEVREGGISTTSSTLASIVMIQARRKAGKREVFGQIVMMKSLVMMTDMAGNREVFGIAVMVEFVCKEVFEAKVLWQTRGAAHAAPGRGPGVACCLGPAAPEEGGEFVPSVGFSVARGGLDEAGCRQGGLRRFRQDVGSEAGAQGNSMCMWSAFPPGAEGKTEEL